MMLGMVPERGSAILAGRADLCETIAICSSDYISRGEVRRLEQLLRSVVERNDELLSTGVRRTSGQLVADINDHAAAWDTSAGQESTDTHVHVPVRSGHERWGSVELRFQPIAKSGVGGWFANPWVQLTIFVAAATYVLFFFYLQKMLAHLDPSQTVPKRVRAALDSLAEGLIVVDNQQRIVLANQSFAQWVGRPPEKLVGSPANKLKWVINEQGDKPATYPWDDAIRLEVAQAGVMVGLQQKNQPLRNLIANASPVLGHDGKYRGVLVSFDDVTQLEDTRRDLHVAKKVAEDANQAKSEFLARMSHEIRTPMNAILGFTDVLRRGFDESIRDRQEYLNTIHANGQHLLTLINDILDLSKIESGRLELELQRHSPHQLISQVVTLLQSKAEEKGISLEFRCEGLLPETILTDAVRLRQTLVNLTGNALKFTESGGVQIIARLIDLPEGQRLSIAVRDSGIGIPEQAIARIFTPFSQADNSITRRFGGTGLGLSISRQLAEALGGGISVHSVPSEGSTFTVTIDPGPLAGIPLLDAATALARVSEQTPESKATGSLPPARILVADDGPSNRKLVQLVLRRAGVEVLAVENGAQAVEQALSQAWDVILMDMQMPVLDGYAATTKLRQAGCQIPIIALTAHAMQGDEAKCRAAGCTGFLTKPINIDQLLATLAAVLNAAAIPQPSNADDGRTLDYAPRIPPQPLLPGVTRNASTTADALVSSLPIDDDDFREIVVEFSKRLDEVLALMDAAWERSDWCELAAHAHWLKGCGGTAGFDAFTAPAHHLEKLAQQQQTEAIPAGLDELRQLAMRITIPVIGIA